MRIRSKLFDSGPLNFALTLTPPRHVGRSCFLGFAVMSTLVLGGCATDSNEYQKSPIVRPLEVPPDLITPGPGSELVPLDASVEEAATFSAYNKSLKGEALPTDSSPAKAMSDERVSLGKEGAQRWLIVKAPVAEIWPKARNFWLENGYTLKRELPNLGLIETEWTDSKKGAPLSSVLRKAFDALYASSTRDKYTLILGPGVNAATTEIFIGHKGMQQININDTANWVARPSEPVLELEMLKRLAVFLGADEKQAKELLLANEAANPAELVKNNTEVAIQMREDFARAWRRITLVLSRTGLDIEDVDRSQGIFYLSGNLAPKQEQPGFWARVFPSDSAPKSQIQLHVKDQGATTRVTLLDDHGKIDNSEIAAQFLSTLTEQLNLREGVKAK